MIKIKQVVDGLKETGIPIRYRVFKSKPPVPFLVYYEDGSTNFFADGEVYYKLDSYIVELYEDQKSLETEEKVEKVFDELGIFWNKEESYVDSEKLNMISYSFSMEGE